MRADPATAAIEAIRSGGMAVVVDDPDRENEGDLVMAARHATAQAVNFMATEGRGLICVPMSRERLERLEIPPMVTRSEDPHGTAFHVGVDLLDHGTGISASDRAATIRALADPEARPSRFARPGHVFPLAGHPEGVLARAGHTEASLDLVRLSGAGDAAVICEIAGRDGEMMRLPELREFARIHDLPLVSISEIRAHLDQRPEVERVVAARVPLTHGMFTFVGYRDHHEGREHVAAVLGELDGAASALVRVHSECLTGDAFGSIRCDCGEQLDRAIAMIAAEGAGAVVYLRGHEGRGIGLMDKLYAYRLQDQGLDTVEANLALGHPADARNYGIGAAILADLGIRGVRLISNNPAKRAGLERHGITVVECVPLATTATAENVRYLNTKRSRLDHTLEPAVSLPAQ